jgi:CheY-like chemotaxis protein
VTAPEPAYGVMLCDDLIFFSRVAATARAAGLVVKQARTAAAVLELARVQPPGGVVVDLHAEGLDVPALLAGLREACPVMPRVVAFGSHVEAETLRAAREAGCDRVLPRSKFVRELETDLKEWLTPSGG